ncbi:MAG: addiction module toxin, HicA family [Candidatus Riflebacteria bacterium]|nr:addiction module toxin, HicA family [Candidatus Riflebacteria bacterium]
MPRLPRITAKETEGMPLAAGFVLERTKGSQRIYRRGDHRIVVPFHAGETLHPKLIAQVIRLVNP